MKTNHILLIAVICILVGIPARQMAGGHPFGTGGGIALGQDCPNNIIQNWSFINGAVQGAMPSPGATSNWTAAYRSPDVHIVDGCGDPAYIGMWGNRVVGEAIQQTLATPFIPGGTYSISFCARWIQNPVRPYPPQFEFRASNVPLTSPQDPNGVLIGVSLPVTSADWVTPVTIPNWTNTTGTSFLILTISSTNQSSAEHGDSTSYGHIDRICVQQCTPGIDSIRTLTMTVCDNSGCVTLAPDGTTLPSQSGVQIAGGFRFVLCEGGSVALSFTLPSSLNCSPSGMMIPVMFSSVLAGWNTTGFSSPPTNFFNPQLPVSIPVFPDQPIYVFLGMTVCIPEGISPGSCDGTALVSYQYGGGLAKLGGSLQQQPMEMAVLVNILPSEPISVERNHYKTWRVEPLPFNAKVNVQDQFMRDSLRLVGIEFLSNPVKKIHPPDTFNIVKPNDHLTWYRAVGRNTLLTVGYVNQFESTAVSIDSVKYLLVPTQKRPHTPPDSLDHYKAYRIKNPKTFRGPITLNDQFDIHYGLPELIDSLKPVYFLTPALKNMELPMLYDSVT
ncbi:MAG: hypothetical protein QME52_11780, partial [Bacteroidota bacterium]|nr:hypothetical protein [Bacteroidota bacterium]